MKPTVKTQERISIAPLIFFVLLLLSVANLAWGQPRVKKKPPEPVPLPVMPAPLPAPPPPLSAQALPYPRAYIERPFTLPKGLDDLSLKGSAVTMNTWHGHIEVPAYLLDIEYRRSVSSDFNWVFNPLPFGLQFQPKRTETTLTGVFWQLGYQFQGNFGVLPKFESFLRYYLDSKAAIEMQLSYGVFIPFEKGSSLWRAYFRLGPIFQQSETLAISPRVWLQIDNVRLDDMFQQGRTRIESSDLIAKSTQLQIPFSLWMDWSFNKSWDLTAEYTILGTGLGSGTYAHMLTTGLTTRF